MNKAALIFARSIAILAIAPAAHAQSWDDNVQGEHQVQSPDDDNNNPDDVDEADTGNVDAAVTGNVDAADTDNGEYDRRNDDQSGEQEIDDEEVYDRDASDQGRTEQDNGGWQGGYALTGSGAFDLHPALRDTPQGRMFVLGHYDLNRDRRINRAFFRLADLDRDGLLTKREVRFALSDRQRQRGSDYETEY